jgi:PAS domain S-box-containing protein
LHHSVRAVSIKSEDTGSDIDIAELAAVQDELRDIAAKGEHAQEALKEREIMYRLLMDQASDALIVHDARGRILEVNQQTCRSLGYAKDELMSQTMVSVEVGLDPAAANARWTSIQPQVPFAHLGALRRKDGTSFRVELSYGCALWKGEKIFLVLARDVTERLEYAENLEKMVEERTAQLQEANEGLEAFSYSVSHDLKAPLRAINGFIAILEADYKENIHPEAKRYCTAISRNAHSMGVLIDEILDFSRISRQTVHKVEVDMEAMAKSVVHVLTDAAAKTQVSVEIETLFPCRGDEAMLRQAWTNLLSNALKYSAKAEAPKIHIRSRKEEGAIVYSVQDNGVGFDMAYREKLFVAFQRLHPATEFEGTGIGLAIVRQIALKHGGSVDASGEEGKGAVFTFSIPQD